MKVLNLYVIYSTQLTNRLKYINSTVELLKKFTDDIGMQFKIIMVKEPTKEYIENHIEEYNKRVNYDKEEGKMADDQFNTLIQTLNICQISNIERHREIYNIIKNLTSNDELHFIIEDDVLLGEDYLHNIKELLQCFYDDKLIDWDILFTCISSIDTKELALVESRQQYKFLLNKSSYFITPSVAGKLYDYLSTFKYSLKNAISKFIWDNKEIKAYVLNKHTFLEGTKMGIFPTSVNNTNFLFQNIHYVNLAKLTNIEHVSEKTLSEAHEHYKQLEKLNNPDSIHTLGVIYYKHKDYENAKKYMVEACEKLEENHGFIAKSSEILNNTINVFQYEQNQLEACKNKKSKYIIG
jgi:GR25 family glycosyltransferase involved in LPS biosynthesis